MKWLLRFVREIFVGTTRCGYCDCRHEEKDCWIWGAEKRISDDPTSQTPEETAFWQRAEDGIVKCNCKFDLGHEPTCAIVAANQQWLNRKREIE